MKPIAALLLVTACLLTGCAETSPAGGTTSDGEAESPLTEQAVLAAYTEAARVYDWFDLCSMPTGIEAIQTDGYIYYPVEEPGIETMADLEAKVRSCFSPELSEEILARGENYREMDGRLWCASAARGSNLFLLDKTVTAAQADENHWTVTLTFWADFTDTTAQGTPTATAGYSTAVLDYEQTDEGWRFATFCSSDGLDLEADTVFTFDYEKDLLDGSYQDFTDWQLVCWLVHADGAYAEAPSDLLLHRFLERPEDILQALALLDTSPYRAHYSHIDAIVAMPGSSAAWLSPEEQTEFLNVVNSCKPQSESEQAVLNKIRTAYESAAESARTAAASRFSLTAGGGPLLLGDQEGTFPWGYDLQAASETRRGAADGFPPTVEADCGDLTVWYNVTTEDGGAERVFRMTTDQPGVPTADGVAVGDSEAAVLSAYPDAAALGAVGESQWGADYALVYEPGQWSGCCHIAFFMKDGAVIAIEVEDLMDGRLLQASAG